MKMDFEEMKIIWDAQNDQPLYAIDQQALHASVKRRGVCIEKSLGVFEFVMIGVLLSVGLILAGKRIFSGEELQTYQYIASALMVVAAICPAAYLLFRRRQRKKQEQQYEPTLLGDLNKSLSQVNSQISRMNTFHFWYVAPMALIVWLNFVARGLSFAEYFDSRRLWAWPLFLAGLVLCYGAIWLEMRIAHRPRKRDLESLREKLLNENE